MFERLEWHFQLIFGLWTSKECDFGEVKKSTFLVVARHLRSHFQPLDQARMRFGGSRKRDVTNCELVV